MRGGEGDVVGLAVQDLDKGDAVDGVRDAPEALQHDRVGGNGMDGDAVDADGRVGVGRASGQEPRGIGRVARGVPEPEPDVVRRVFPEGTDLEGGRAAGADVERRDVAVASDEIGRAVDRVDLDVDARRNDREVGDGDAVERGSGDDDAVDVRQGVGPFCSQVRVLDVADVVRDIDPKVVRGVVFEVREGERAGSAGSDGDRLFVRGVSAVPDVHRSDAVGVGDPVEIREHDRVGPAVGEREGDAAHAGGRGV